MHACKRPREPILAALKGVTFEVRGGRQGGVRVGQLVGHATKVLKYGVPELVKEV